MKGVAVAGVLPASGDSSQRPLSRQGPGHQAAWKMCGLCATSAREARHAGPDHRTARLSRQQ